MRSAWNKGKKLHYQVWNKGVKRPDFVGNQFAKGNPPNRTSFKKGVRVSPQTEFQKGTRQDGSNNANWKGGYTKLKVREKVAGRPKPLTCEVCGDGGMICFDHCHQTGKFRGWLCSRCNFALGNARDNPQLLEALAKYLREVQ